MHTVKSCQERGWKIPIKRHKYDVWWVNYAQMYCQGGYVVRQQSPERIRIIGWSGTDRPTDSTLTDIQVLYATSHVQCARHPVGTRKYKGHTSCIRYRARDGVVRCCKPQTCVLMSLQLLQLLPVWSCSVWWPQCHVFIIGNIPLAALQIDWLKIHNQVTLYTLLIHFMCRLIHFTRLIQY